MFSILNLHPCYPVTQILLTCQPLLYLQNLYKIKKGSFSFFYSINSCTIVFSLILYQTIAPSLSTFCVNTPTSLISLGGSYQHCATFFRTTTHNDLVARFIYNH